MRITVLELIQSDVAFSSEMGQRVRDAYGDTWRGEIVELDFTGIRNVSPSFLSQATMPLLQAFDVNTIQNHLKFTSAPQSLGLIWEKILSAVRAQKTDDASQVAR
jgi:hypothetical protein